MLKEEEYYKMVRAAMKKYNFEITEDLIQEMVTYIAGRMDKYDATKSSLTTFVYNTVRLHYFSIYRSRKAKKRSGEIINLSLDEYVGKDNNIPLLEALCDNTDLEYNLIKNKVLESIIPLVEYELKLWLEGKTQEEISVITNSSQAQVCRKIAKNIEDIKLYCKNNDINLRIK